MKSFWKRLFSISIKPPHLFSVEAALGLFRRRRDEAMRRVADTGSHCARKH